MAEGIDVLRELVAKLGFDVDEHGLDAFNKQISGAKLALEGLVVAWHVAVIGAFEIARETADAGDEIESMALTLGLGVEAYQKYSYAAMVANVGQEQFNTGVQFLTRNMGDAIRGVKTAQQAFAALGVSYSQGGRLRSTEAVLGDIADALSKVKDPALRNSYAVDLFGRAGARMGAFLAQGREEVERLSQAVTDFGFFDEERIRLATEGDSTFKALFATIRGLRNELGIRLLPGVTRVIRRFLDWLHVHRDLINQKIDAYARRLSEFIEAGAKVALALARALGAVAHALGGVNTALQIFAILVVSVAVARLIQNFEALLQVVRSLAIVQGILDIEFLAIAAAVALVALAVQDLYVWFKGGDSVIGEWLGSWEEVKDRFARLWEDMKRPLRDFVSFFRHLIRGEFREAMSDAERLLGDLGGIREDLGQTLSPTSSRPKLGAALQTGLFAIPGLGQLYALATAATKPGAGQLAVGLPGIGPILGALDLAHRGLAAGRAAFGGSFVPSPAPAAAPFYLQPSGSPGTPGVGAPMFNFEQNFTLPQGTPEEHVRRVAEAVAGDVLRREVEHSLRQSTGR